MWATATLRPLRRKRLNIPLALACPIPHFPWSPDSRGSKMIGWSLKCVSVTQEVVMPERKWCRYITARRRESWGGP